MKKVYTELYYESDCGNYTIHCKDEDTYGIFFEQSNLEHWVDMTDLVGFYNFLGEFLKENNKSIEHAIDNTPKRLTHDPRFDPDPDGVLGL